MRPQEIGTLTPKEIREAPDSRSRQGSPFIVQVGKINAGME